MKRPKPLVMAMIMGILALILVGGALAAGNGVKEIQPLPRSLESYGDESGLSIPATLKNRVQQEPFNLVATVVFFCAIIHTFLTARFLAVAHKWEHEHEAKIEKGLASKRSVHHGAELYHFLGEVEVVFGLWAVALVAGVVFFYDWNTLTYYIEERVDFTEAIFVVVIMTLAATRPILKISEQIMAWVARTLGGSLKAWWFTVLSLGPILGSFITEPAAMTIAAMLLSNKFYELEPSNKFKYATLGLLFVNISVGGTLTHFAAPPVLMVAGPWKWGMGHMVVAFGLKAVVGILISNAIYFLAFRGELDQLQHKFALRELKDEIQRKFITREELEAEIGRIGPVIDNEIGFSKRVDRKVQRMVARVKARLEEKYLPGLLDKGLEPEIVKEAFDMRFNEIRTAKLRELHPGVLTEEERPPFVDPDWDKRDDPVPVWVTLIHVIFMAWTIFNAHHPVFFVPGLLFFLGFAVVTSPYQNRIDLKPPLLVGFFLGGLVVHGGLQGWWIAPVLGSLKELPLMLGATVLTAFNDNAAITYLSTLVPGFTDSLKYAVVAGAVAGGGLTIIANAPNPAGQALLKRHFDNNVSPTGLLKAAIIPTLVMLLIYAIFL